MADLSNIPPRIEGAGGGGGGGCFKAGTRVSTPNGAVAIETLVPGDAVWAFDEGGNVRPAVVRELHVHENNDLLHVQFWGGEIFVTPHHWVLNQYNAFVEMGTLKLEDALVDMRGHLRPITGISAYGNETVYNLTVEPYHTYVADGIRVHNGGGGGKSGGGGGSVNTRAPVESPNTLRSVATARVLDLLGEGRSSRGLANGAQSIFFDETPLEGPDGSSNFNGVKWVFRDGSPDQDPIPGFDEVETEQSVETDLTQRLGPVTRTITNTDVDAARVRIRLPNLSLQDPITGDLQPYNVAVRIEVKPSDGAYRNVDFVFEEDEIEGSLSTGSACIGFRAVLTKRQLVKLNTPSECTLELRYRRGGGSYTSLGPRTISRVVRNVPDVNSPDGYLDGQPAYYHSFTTTYSLMGLGADSYEVQVAQGDTVSSLVAFRQSNLNIEGKNTAPTEKSYRFSLPGTGPWQIRVSRVTPDTDKVNEQNLTIWSAYTEIIEEKFIYPDSMYLGIAVNSELFGNKIPKRSYDVYGKDVLVPSNYDPITRTYAGLWDGNFRMDWSDNPAWCFLDMLINDRFGLGHILDVDDVDTAKLYEVSQFCDELVPDGYGGMEPRFTLNCVINTRSEAYQLLNTMVSVFRGMIFWHSASVSLGNDAPREVDVIVGRANVLGGEFNYQTASEKVQYNSVLVTWNDPNDFDRPNIEVVEDNQDISRRGLRQTEIYAFGCKSRGQASRLGKWTLYTSRYEMETVTYRCGLDHLNVVPGMIAGIVDPQVSGADYAGRIVSTSGTEITLDRVVELASGETYELAIMDPQGGYQRRTIIGNGGDTTSVLNISGVFNPQPQPNAMWSIIGTDVEPRQFRIISLVEVEDNIFEVSGIEYNPSKHNFVDRDFTLDPVPFTTYSTGAPQPPVGPLQVVETLFKSNNQVRTRATLSWQASPDSRVYLYRVLWRTSDGGIIQEKYTGSEAIELIDLEPNFYDFFVYGVAASGESQPLFVTSYEILGKRAPPGDVENFTALRKVNGVVLSWSPVVDLDLVGYVVQRGTIWDAPENEQIEIIGTTVFMSLNDALPATFLIRAKDESQILSTGVTSLVSSVIEPDVPSRFTAVAQADYVLFRWARTPGIDNVYEIRRGLSWALAEKIAESTADELLILDPQRDDAIYWIKAKSTAGLFSTEARAASAQRALIPDRNVVLEYDNANDGGAGLYPGWTFNLEEGPDDSLVLEEISAGIYQPHGEHYYAFDLGQEYMARNWMETTIINLAGSGPTWEEWAYAWEAIESQVAWLPLQDLDGAALEKVIAWGRDPLDEELYAWTFDNTLSDFRAEVPTASANVTYSEAKFGDGLFVSDLTTVEYDVVTDFTFTVMFKLRVEEPLDNKRVMLVLKTDGEAERLEIGFDAAVAGGSIYVLDNLGQMLYLPITQSLAGLNFLSVAMVQHSDRRVIYYRSEREYLSLEDEAPYEPLANTFDKLYLHNEP